MEPEVTADAEYMKGIKHLSEIGVERVPARYILPSSDRPHPESGLLELPTVDLSDLRRGSSHRDLSLSSLADACLRYGVFQVENHGLPAELLRSMVEVTESFFELPFEEREIFMSSDVASPVRYGTSFNQSTDGVFCWRDFLKLTCRPLADTLPLWPSSPANLREVVATYVNETRRLFLALMEAVMETLGVEDDKMKEELKDGSQLMVLNYYPSCPEPELTLGMPSHSDYGFLTLVLQGGVGGLQTHHEGHWVNVNAVSSSIIVILGDHLEIFSNGKYKSAQHRVVVNSYAPRASVASLHSLPSSSTISPSPQLIGAGESPRYMDTSFADFIAYLSSRGTQGKSFLESRKLTH